MGGEENGRAFAVQQLDGGLQELAARHGVQAAGGLVQDQQLGPVADRAEQRRLTRLPLAQAPDFGAARQREPVQKLALQVLIPAGKEIAVECDQLGDGGTGRQHLVLGDEADAPLHLDRVFGGGEAEDAHRAAIGG